MNLEYLEYFNFKSYFSNLIKKLEDLQLNFITQKYKLNLRLQYKKSNEQYLPYLQLILSLNKT